MNSHNALAAISTNVNVGIDEVVAIFVSRYETQLYQKKEALSAKIKSLKAEVAKITSDLVESVDKTQYDIDVPKLDLKFMVHSIDIQFDKPDYGQSKIGIHVKIGLYDKTNTSRDYPDFSKLVVLPIDKAVTSRRKDILKEVEHVSADLVEVMSLIKTVGRKERQVRGKIAEMKMEQAGQVELLANPDLMKLISMN